ncbi:MAG: 50S ribosomal protein L30 [Thermoplasmata archaeon]|nr:50S ribosomal protein L30 [Thermoplasmata archaeon]
MRAAIRLRSDINANIEVKDTLKHLRLNKINHCVLIPKEKTYDGMLQKVKDYVTWGEVKPEALTNMIIKRGRLTGNRTYDNKYVKENTKSESMVKYAEAIITGKEKYSNLKDVQPLFRLHPPIKGHKAIKKSFNAGGDLGYRGEEINNLILKMLGPVPKTPVKKETAPPKTEAAPLKKKAEPKKTPAKKEDPKKPAEKKAPVKKAAAPKKEPTKKAPAKKPAAKKEVIK